MKKFLMIAFAFIAVFSNLNSVCSAHEGHDQIPGKIKSTKGGEVLQPYGKFLNIEVVKLEGFIKIYPLSHPGDKLDIDHIQIKAQATSTRSSAENKSKGKEIIFKKVTQPDEHFEAVIDLAGESHLDLDIEVTLNNKNIDHFKTTID